MIDTKKDETAKARSTDICECGDQRSFHVDRLGCGVSGCGCTKFVLKKDETATAQPVVKDEKVCDSCRQPIYWFDDGTGYAQWKHVKRPENWRTLICWGTPEPLASGYSAEDLGEAEHDNQTLEAETHRLRQERDMWRRKYFEMEHAQSRSIDQNGEHIKRIQRLERDKDEIRSDRDYWKSAAEWAQRFIPAGPTEAPHEL